MTTETIEVSLFEKMGEFVSDKIASVVKAFRICKINIRKVVRLVKKFAFNDIDVKVEGSEVNEVVNEMAEVTIETTEETVIQPVVEVQEEQEEDVSEEYDSEEDNVVLFRKPDDHKKRRRKRGKKAGSMKREIIE
jgi:hypothetical protein